MIRLPAGARRLFSKASRPALESTEPHGIRSGVLSAGVKLPWRKVDCLPLTSADGKNDWDHAFIHVIRLHGVHSDNFTFDIIWAVYRDIFA